MMRRLLMGAVLLAIPVFAQEAGAPAEKPSMFLWQTLNFLIIAGLIGWLAMKHGGPLLSARSGEIREGLAAGEKAKAEADARAAQVQAQLANLGKEIEVLRAAAKEERDSEANRIRRETQTEIARIQLQAEHEIESAGKQARMEIQSAAAKAAIALAENIVRSRMSPEVQAGLLQGFIADLPGSAASRLE